MTDALRATRLEPSPMPLAASGQPRRRRAAWLTMMFAAWAASASGQTPGQARPAPFEPEVGQVGKDVVWVPTPAALVERMLDMARVTRDDLVMDLGSGDGRNIIAAAKRGARAIGVEYNPDMVALSRRLAQEAGVSDRATFVEGDMFTADISKANVMALFLLPSNLERLRPTFLGLAPGSRLVMNTFDIPDWKSDEQQTIDDCVSWCTAHLYIVPARVEGRWSSSRGTLTLRQEFQMVAGTLEQNGVSTAVHGQLRGTALTLEAEGQTLTATVTGDRFDGRDGAGRTFSGTRVPAAGGAVDLSAPARMPR